MLLIELLSIFLFGCYQNIAKKGRVTLFMNEKGEYYSGREDWMSSALETVFENGKVVKTYTFDEIRANANKF